MTDEETATHQQLHEAMQFVWAKNPECAKVLKSFIDDQSKKLEDMAEQAKLLRQQVYVLSRLAAYADFEVPSYPISVISGWMEKNEKIRRALEKFESPRYRL